MSAVVRAKCRLAERTEIEWGGVRLMFMMRPDAEIPKAERISKECAGRFEVTVKNEDNAALRFRVGQEYSFEIHPLPPPVVETSTAPAQASTESQAAPVAQAPVAPTPAAPAEVAPAPVAAPQPAAPVAADAALVAPGTT